MTLTLLSKIQTHPKLILIFYIRIHHPLFFIYCAATAPYSKLLRTDTVAPMRTNDLFWCAQYSYPLESCLDQMWLCLMWDEWVYLTENSGSHFYNNFYWVRNSKVILNTHITWISLTSMYSRSDLLLITKVFMYWRIFVDWEGIFLE